jgi:hypothetical protein
MQAGIEFFSFCAIEGYATFCVGYNAENSVFWGSGMREWLGAVFFASTFFFGTATWAADVQSVQGDLSINQGRGFQAVNGRIDANVGDSLIVGPNGSAMVSYPDGCQVSVQPGAVTTIGPLSPCAAGSFAQTYQDKPYQDWTPFIVAGVVAAAAATAGILYLARQSNSTTKPASP